MSYNSIFIYIFLVIVTVILVNTVKDNKERTTKILKGGVLPELQTEKFDEKEGNHVTESSVS